MLNVLTNLVLLYRCHWLQWQSVNQSLQYDGLDWIVQCFTSPLQYDAPQ